jgi:hypothetical protein
MVIANHVAAQSCGRGIQPPYTISASGTGGTKQAAVDDGGSIKNGGTTGKFRMFT